MSLDVAGAPERSPRKKRVIMALDEALVEFVVDQVGDAGRIASWKKVR
jgi:hypothetical protein